MYSAVVLYKKVMQNIMHTTYSALCLAMHQKLRWCRSR